MIKIGTYKHFKGKTCEVIAVGEHSETGETFVVYNLENGNTKCRPMELFLQKAPEGSSQKFKFEYLGGK